jgi:hypothetical protein
MTGSEGQNRELHRALRLAEGPNQMMALGRGFRNRLFRERDPPGT